jgi:hypothetical protein
MKKKTKKKKVKALIVVVVSDDMGLDYCEVVEATYQSALITKVEKMLPKIVKDFYGKDIGEDDITDILDGDAWCIVEQGFLQVKFL